MLKKYSGFTVPFYIFYIRRGLKSLFFSREKPPTTHIFSHAIIMLIDCREYPFQDKKNEDEEKKKKVKILIVKLFVDPRRNSVS